MLFLLLALTLGVANAGNLLYEVQQQEQEPPSDGFLCPDQASKCPNTATCCQLSNGKWGCCPFIRATCCADNVHCCPNGYSCNKGKEQCVKAIDDDTIPWAEKMEASLPSQMTPAAEKLPAILLAESDEEKTTQGPLGLIRCDRTHFCQTGQTCCRRGGSWGCCPYRFATCCFGGVRCCPFGKRCTYPAGLCY